MMGWDDLRHVLAVGRTGGVSGAARQLGVTHTTVSRRIAALEERLGVRLFDRLPNGQVPTDAGREAIAVAEEMEHAVTGLERRVVGQDAELQGQVVLTAPLMVLMGPFMQVVAQFCAVHPQVALKVLATTDLLDLHRRDADIALRATDAPDERLFGVRLTGQRSAIYATPGYLDRFGETLRRAPEEVALDWIGHTGHDQPLPEIAAVYPRARLSLALDDKLAMLAAAKADMGVVRLPCFHGDRDSALMRVPGLGLFRYPDKWVLTHPDLRHTARVRLVMRFITDAVRSERALFMGERPRIASEELRGAVS